jgi:hypothetical protein
MTVLHLVLTISILPLAFGGGWGPAGAAAFLIASQLLVPLLSVVYRGLRNRRFLRPLAAVFLYWVFYWARTLSMMKILLSGPRRRRPVVESNAKAANT